MLDAVISCAAVTKEHSRQAGQCAAAAPWLRANTVLSGPAMLLPARASTHAALGSSARGVTCTHQVMKCHQPFPVTSTWHPGRRKAGIMTYA